MMHGFNGMGFGMGWAWIIGFAIIGVFIWMLIKVANQNSSAGPSGNKSALDTLKERYARGEISREEFEERKKVIL